MLPFSAILSGRVLQQWGGVEVDVRYGEVDDAGWYITPDENMPEEFPLAVTLYLPNGWQPVMPSVLSGLRIPRPISCRSSLLKSMGSTSPGYQKDGVTACRYRRGFLSRTTGLNC